MALVRVTGHQNNIKSAIFPSHACFHVPRMSHFCINFVSGLYTRTILDAIIESSRTGMWSRVEFIAHDETGQAMVGSEEKTVQITTEQQKEKPDEKEYPSPVLRKMLTQ